MNEKGYTLSRNSSLMLDLMRALASQAVVVGHGISFFGIWPAVQPPRFPYIQNVAVVVFFVLSGFLITYATLRKPAGYTFREFFIDRFARIYSAYFVVLLVVWGIDRYAIHVDPAAYGYADALNWRTFLGNVVMLQDFPRGEVHGLLLVGAEPGQRVITSLGSARPFWTLAIEWWIYMGFGWVVLRRWKSPLYYVVLACLLVVPAYNLIGGRGNGLALMWIFGGAMCLVISHPRIRAIGTGALVFAALGFGALSIALLRITKEPYDPKYAALFGAALLCAVLAIDRVQWTPPALVTKSIRFIANYSFALYLLHYTILNLMTHAPVLESPTANFVLAVVVCNVASIIVAYFTEFRHQKLAAWLKTKLNSRT
jgi:peptidoglycan/LPS O-acetylase OafA/YrhL